MSLKIRIVVAEHNASWTALALVQLAILWAWSPESSLVESANHAIRVATKIFGSAAVNSYQALIKVLKTNSSMLIPVLWVRIHKLMEQSGKKKWRVGLWLALAVDGSRLNVPRTKDNERNFSKPANKKKSKKKGKKNRGRTAQQRKQAAARKKKRQKKNYNPQAVGPQMWLTMIWHISLHIPWCWKTGPSYSSERQHLQELLKEVKFPENTLFCGDAGFVGYDFWQSIADAEHHFLMRVGGNVRLLKKLCHAREKGGIVYCWPSAAMKKKQPPLKLRVLHMRDGKGDVYLVTNVLDETKLSGKTASEIYRGRWGVEVQFRSFKQTFKRTKLRSRSAASATQELDWSLMGLTMIELLACKEQAGERNLKMSVASALRIVRRAMYETSEPVCRGQSLSDQLAVALTDTYRRTSKKKSRNYPRRKEEPGAGKPKITIATKKHRQQLKEIEFQNAA